MAPSGLQVEPSRSSLFPLRVPRAWAETHRSELGSWLRRWARLLSDTLAGQPVLVPSEFPGTLASIRRAYKLAAPAAVNAEVFGAKSDLGMLA
jgi:hypothetical protein